MKEIFNVNYDDPKKPLISGREIHKFLGIKTKYKDWFPRMCKYGFEEGKDFCEILSKSTGGRPATDHMITTSMAKELCVIQRNAKGQEVRKEIFKIENNIDTNKEDVKMTNLIKINYDNPDRPLVSGREIHSALKVKTQYTKWFERMCEYGFSENTDYVLVSQNCQTNNPKNPWTTVVDHMITIPMAKELCMIQRTDIGKKIRQYFISVEEAWNSPDAVINRALVFSQNKIASLQESVNQLTYDNELLKPKADYFDDLVDKKLLTGIRDTAKEFHVGQKEFVDALIENKFLYRDNKRRLKPYMRHVRNGLFEIKECLGKDYAGIQTFITPKGKQEIRDIVNSKTTLLVCENFKGERKKLTAEDLPNKFKKYYDMICDGRISKATVANICAVSVQTIYNWIKIMKSAN